MPSGQDPATGVDRVGRNNAANFDTGGAEAFVADQQRRAVERDYRANPKPEADPPPPAKLGPFGG